MREFERSPEQRDESFPYEILKSKEQRDFILSRGEYLVDLIEERNYDSVVIVDRSARPISWIIDAFWQKKYTYEAPPKLIYLNTGRKHFRERYATFYDPQTPFYIKKSERPFHFSGVESDQRSIRSFLQEIRKDEAVHALIDVELGEEGRRNLEKKRVLVADDIEQEGIQRLFITQILRDLYKPKTINHFQWDIGETLPKHHGLSYKENKNSFIAVPTRDIEEYVRAIKTKREIDHLIFTSESN